jgi:hypothetical protein
MCERFGFKGSQFIRDASYDGYNVFPAQDRTAYDVGSIMHYSSTAFANDWCRVEDRLDECPLAVYKDANHHKLSVRWMKPNQTPSSTDAVRVKNGVSVEECGPGRS